MLFDIRFYDNNEIERGVPGSEVKLLSNHEEAAAGRASREGATEEEIEEARRLAKQLDEELAELLDGEGYVAIDAADLDVQKVKEPRLVYSPQVF